MSSFLARIFGWSGGGRATKQAPSRPKPPPAAGPQYRSDFTYSDTSTWTFPHQSVSSSNIASVAYDFEEQVLEIKFLEASANHSNTYRYSEVPLVVYRSLMSVPSPGHYHWTHIRGRYAYADVG